jgi:uncharacterized membrane protein
MSIPQTTPKRIPVAVALLTVLVGGLGLLRLGTRGIWLDESTSIWYAQHTWRALLDVVAGEDTNMSAYYGLLWFWRHTFGDSVFAMRSLSVLAAALTVPAVYAVGSRLFGRPAGLVAATLIASNAFFLRYAQEARAYSLVALLVTLSSYFFLGELEKTGWRNRTGYVACSVLAFYAHFFAAYVILVQIAYLAAIKRRAALTREWLVQYLAIAFLVAPIGYVTLTLYWDPIAWIPPSGWPDLPDKMRELAGNSYWLLGVILALGLLAIPMAARSPRLGTRLAFPAAWFLAPVMSSFAVSYAKPMFLSKYLIVCVPALALFAGGVIVNLRPRAMGIAVLTALVALSIHPLVNWYERPPDQNWKALTRYVLDRTRSGDAVVLQRFSLPFEYYSSHSGLPTPREVAHNKNWRTLSALPNPRVWVVLSHPGSALPFIRSALLGGGYEMQRRRVFGDSMAVELFGRS